MKRTVMLSLQGKQTYPGQEPELIELMTDGTLEEVANGWIISYDESSLTGLEGVTTNFHIQNGCVTLTRTGKLQSQMVFQQGVRHDSLYQMEFGALLMTVCATHIDWKLSSEGGTVDLKYLIEIEHSVAGTVEYHLGIQTVVK